MAIPNPPAAEDLVVGKPLPDALEGLRAAAQAIIDALGPDLDDVVAAYGESTLAEVVGGLKATYARRLGRTHFHPSTAANIETTSTTLVAVDATNLVVSFTAPDNGEVTVRLSALARNATGQMVWALWDVAADAKVDNSEFMVLSASGATGYVRPFYEAVITGLTPGQDYTYQWRWRAQSESTNRISRGASFGPAIMEVVAGKAL